MLTVSLDAEIERLVKPSLSGGGDLGRVLFSGWKKAAASAEYNAVKAANDRLEKAVSFLKWGGFNLMNTDYQCIDDYCEARATRCFDLLPNYPIKDSAAVITEIGKLFDHGLELKIPIDEYEADKYLRGMYERICCKNFWRRKLRVAQKIRTEVICRDYDLVSKYRGAYVSDLSLDVQKKQQKRNTELLENIEAVNDLGEFYSLAELQKLSVSNPDVRRAEFMSRARGFQIMAEGAGHVAVFWTLTCPSRFHSHNIGGKKNKKHNGETVRDAQNYLCSMWAAFRSWASRNGIEFYGFRIAEPHHDGCPHWHILVFGEKEKLERATKELLKRALQTDGDERGALENRFTAKWIRTGKTKDGRQLSAAGYIAKYIAKSIDGFGGSGDSSIDANGERFDMEQDSETGAARVIAWARTHGIRQFQQIGGAYVSVWRELRKLHGKCEDEDAREIVEAVEEKMAVDAAVAWAVFNLMSGSGDSQRLKLWRSDLRPVSTNTVLVEMDYKYSEKWGIDIPHPRKVASHQKEFLTPAYTNSYGDTVAKIKGLVLDGATKIKTRFYQWVLMKKDKIYTDKSLGGAAA